MTLQGLCAARGLTLDQLAERADVLPATVAKIATGAIRAQPSTLRHLAAVLGLEPDALQLELSAARRARAAGGDPDRMVRR